MTDNAEAIKAALAEAANEDTRGITRITTGQDGQLQVEAYAGRPYDPPIPFDTTDEQWLTYRSHFDSMAAFLRLALVHFDEAMCKVDDLGCVRIIIDEGGFDGAPPSEAATMAATVMAIKRALAEESEARDAGTRLRLDSRGTLEIVSYAGRRLDPTIMFDATDTQWLTCRSYCASITEFLDMALANLDDIMNQADGFDRVCIIIDESGFMLHAA